MKTKFAKRLQELRTTYGLSANKLASLLGFKWASSVANIEKEKTMITTDTLIALSHLFGISIDWILGFSEIQYNEPLITSIEDELKTKPFIKNNTELLILLSSNENRTLEQRSHIIFKLQYLELEFNEKKEKLDQLIIINF